jgi:hypothetical protein
LFGCRIRAKEAVNLTQIISVAGIVIAAAVGLVIAYLHRKQMRQLELYRQNPEAGLRPPPHPFAAFLRRWGLDVLFMVVLPVIALVRLVTDPNPVSRPDTLLIAFLTVLFVIGFLLLIFKVASGR